MTDTAPLTLDAIGKHYGQTVVLDNVSLIAEPGQITALLGPSGAGKSTLLRLVVGLEPPTSGTIKSGQTLLSSTKQTVSPEKRNIGLIFQDFALFPNMTVEDNVRFGLKNYSKEETGRIAREWIDRLGMAHRSSAFPHQMSGGEQQRIAIARALAAKPAAIMMDEPFSGLDPDTRETVRDIALKAVRASKIPAIMVTHDPAEALAHADKIAILQTGTLVQTGTPDDVFLNPSSLSVASAFGTLHSVQTSQLPESWLGILQTGKTEMHYREMAFKIDKAAHSAPVTIASLKRVGAYHKVGIALPSGTTLTTQLLLTSAYEIGDTLPLSPLPQMFHSF